MTDEAYALGHAPREIRRLELQADLLRPATLRLLSECDLRAGMSVLDVGTGAGDVALLAAGIVGSKGRVVGIDRNEDVLAHARKRTTAEAQPRFVQADLDGLAPHDTFDLVICRYVLIHQADPVGFLQQAARHVVRGGRLALLETASAEGSSFAVPPVPLYHAILADLREAFGRSGSDLGVGLRLVQIFAAAGLPEPTLFAEQLVGGAESALPQWIVETWKSTLPMLAAAGRPSCLDPDHLLDELRDATRRARAQLFGPRNVAAWVTLA